MANKSEVAALLHQIEREYEAGQAALHSMAYGTARHDFISARMEGMENARQALVAEVGQDAATPLFNAVLERTKKPS